MRHNQYDAAQILTLNLATCITEGSQQEQDETAALDLVRLMGEPLGYTPPCLCCRTSDDEGPTF